MKCFEILQSHSKKIASNEDVILLNLPYNSTSDRQTKIKIVSASAYSGDTLCMLDDTPRAAQYSFPIYRIEPVIATKLVISLNTDGNCNSVVMNVNVEFILEMVYFSDVTDK